ncbi:MAG: hypothetical protein PHE83_05720 [Opitutaceae bacterium]|nr:hypothetical protein [Opitutaceae bacterium]
MSAVSTMSFRYASTAHDRGEILIFLHAAQGAGYRLCREDPLLGTWTPTPDDIEGLLDAHFGIDRAALNAERAAQLQPGAECACGE